MHFETTFSLCIVSGLACAVNGNVLMMERSRTKQFSCTELFGYTVLSAESCSIIAFAAIASASAFVSTT